jgi:hypothetical protein
LAQENPDGPRILSSIDGLAALQGIGPTRGEGDLKLKRPKDVFEGDKAFSTFANDADPWKAHLAAIDALLDRTSKVLAGETPLLRGRSHLVHDPDVDDAGNEDVWT